jgi:hypothetical protein
METTGSAGVRWRLVDQWGNQLNNRVPLATGTFDVPRAGRYTIMVEGLVDGAAASLPYSIALTRFSDSPEALPRRARHGEPGPAGPAAQLHLHARRGQDDVLRRALGQFGDVVDAQRAVRADRDRDVRQVGRRAGAAIKPLNLTAGTYTVTVTSSGPRRARSGSRCSTPRMPPRSRLGAPMTGALAPAAETDLWKFRRPRRALLPRLRAASRRRRSAHPHHRSDRQGSVRLRDRADMEFTPLRSGTYIITIEGNPANAAPSEPYRFALHRARDITVPLQLNGALTGPFAEARDGGSALALTGHETIRATAPRSTPTDRSRSTCGSGPTGSMRRCRSSTRAMARAGGALR